MGARSGGREAALQILFAVEATAASAESVARDYWRELPGDPEGREYAAVLVAGVMAEREALDARLSAASKNWRLERMTRVDRNVLRIAAWELLHQPEPRAVILDEAVEMAKRFGTEDSSAFVNGVLTRVADDSGRAEPHERGDG